MARRPWSTGQRSLTPTPPTGGRALLPPYSPFGGDPLTAKPVSPLAYGPGPVGAAASVAAVGGGGGATGPAAPVGGKRKRESSGASGPPSGAPTGGVPEEGEEGEDMVASVPPLRPRGDQGLVSPCPLRASSSSSSSSSAAASLTSQGDLDVDHYPARSGHNRASGKRISPFHNTPIQRKEAKRKLLRVSLLKVKHIENPETFLRRSVLINNLVRRLQCDMSEDKHWGEPLAPAHWDLAYCRPSPRPPSSYSCGTTTTTPSAATAATTDTTSSVATDNPFTSGSASSTHIPCDHAETHKRLHGDRRTFPGEGLLRTSKWSPYDPQGSLAAVGGVVEDPFNEQSELDRRLMDDMVHSNDRLAQTVDRLTACPLDPDSPDDDNVGGGDPEGLNPDSPNLDVVVSPDSFAISAREEPSDGETSSPSPAKRRCLDTDDNQDNLNNAMAAAASTANPSLESGIGCLSNNNNNNNVNNNNNKGEEVARSCVDCDNHQSAEPAVAAPAIGPVTGVDNAVSLNETSRVTFPAGDKMDLQVSSEADIPCATPAVISTEAIIPHATWTPKVKSDFLGGEGGLAPGVMTGNDDGCALSMSASCPYNSPTAMEMEMDTGALASGPTGSSTTAYSQPMDYLQDHHHHHHQQQQQQQHQKLFSDGRLIRCPSKHTVFIPCLPAGGVVQTEMLHPSAAPYSSLMATVSSPPSSSSSSSTSCATTTTAAVKNSSSPLDTPRLPEAATTTPSYPTARDFTLPPTATIITTQDNKRGGLCPSGRPLGHHHPHPHPHVAAGAGPPSVVGGLIPLPPSCSSEAERFEGLVYLGSDYKDFTEQETQLLREFDTVFNNLVSILIGN